MARRKRKKQTKRKPFVYAYDPNNIIECPDTGESVKGNMYLESRHWRLLSRRIWIERGKKCEMCGCLLPVRGDAAVHHESYKNIGREHGNELVLVCHDCHKRIHDGGNRTRRDDVQKIWNNMTYTQRAALLEAAREIIGK